MVKEFISQLPPDKLSPFAEHPYRVREDAAAVEPTRVDFFTLVRGED